MNYTYCGHCGFENVPENNFCIRCGAKLEKQNVAESDEISGAYVKISNTIEKSEEPKMAQVEKVVEEFQPEENFYTQATIAYKGAPVFVSEIQPLEVQRFVLDNSDVYTEVFGRIENGSMLIPNWGALLFGSFWFLYRKLYLLGVVLFAVQIGVLMFSFKAFAIITILFHVFAFLAGNNIYWQYVKKHIEQSKFMDYISKQVYFKEKGSTSFSAVTLVLFASFIIAVARTLWPLWF